MFPSVDAWLAVLDHRQPECSVVMVSRIFEEGNEGSNVIFIYAWGQ